MKDIKFGIRPNWLTFLYFLVANIFRQSLSFHEDAENIIWHLQNNTNYGIHTNYDVNYDPNGSDVNVETTSLVIGLYKWPEVFSQSIISPVCEIGYNLVGVVVISALITSVGSYLLWKGRRIGFWRRERDR